MFKKLISSTLTVKLIFCSFCPKSPHFSIYYPLLLPIYTTSRNPLINLNKIMRLVFFSLDNLESIWFFQYPLFWAAKMDDRPNWANQSSSEQLGLTLKTIQFSLSSEKSWRKNDFEFSCFIRNHCRKWSSKSRSGSKSESLTKGRIAISVSLPVQISMTRFQSVISKMWHLFSTILAGAKMSENFLGGDVKNVRK